MRILLALPDRDLLAGLTKLLTLDGHTVDPVFDGVQALSHAAAEKPDLAVLDGYLPRVPLPDLIKQLREMGIFALLFWDAPETAESLVEKTGAAAVLTYPFSSDDLSRRLLAMKEGAFFKETV